MKTSGNFNKVPAGLVRALFANLCLDTGNGARYGDWPEWWDHEGTSESVRANAERLRSEVERAAGGMS